ncbi:MAG: hypothetical protein ACJAVO_001572 [Parvibaculaceae bacterium]|jgi:hypothetical protein
MILQNRFPNLERPSWELGYLVGVPSVSAERTEQIYKSPICRGDLMMLSAPKVNYMQRP